MSELVKAAPAPSMTLAQQMDYAQTVAAGSLVPQTYRNNPANVLIAMGLGQSMGLSPIESLYRIDVIQGTPTAGAELIAANVRKAGHKLRVQGDDNSATAEIVRADDPDYTFSATRDVAWAQAMGLSNKDNYKKQRGTMLQWRAITAVARLACPEALYGVAYTADELGDTNPAGTEPKQSGTARIRQAMQAETEPAMEDLGEKDPRDFLAEAEALDGDVDGLRALWLDAQAAGEPRAHLDTIAAMATTEANEAPAS